MSTGHELTARGANTPSLVEAQINYRRCGAMEDRFIGFVKGVRPSDRKDPEWREVVEADREFVTTPARLYDADNHDLDCWLYWKTK